MKNPAYEVPWAKREQKLDWMEYMEQKYAKQDQRKTQQLDNKKVRKGKAPASRKRRKLEGVKVESEVLSTAIDVGSAQSDEENESGNATPGKKSNLPLYLWNEWWLTREQWAHYPREALTILLQITTTNANESFHNALKAESMNRRQNIASYSREGCVRTTVEVSTQWWNRSQMRAQNNNIKNVVSARRYPALKKLPLLLQKITVKELQKAKLLIKENEFAKPFKDKIECDCKFYRAWYVPCKHIWQRELLYNHLTAEDWDDIAFRFEEGGLDVYEAFTKDFVEPLVNEAVSESDQWTLKAKEQFELLRSAWFSFIETTANFPPEQMVTARTNWLSGLTRALGPFHRAEARQFLNDDDIGYAQMFPDIMELNLGGDDDEYGEYQPPSTGQYVKDALRGLQVPLEDMDKAIIDGSEGMSDGDDETEDSEPGSDVGDSEGAPESLYDSE